MLWFELLVYNNALWVQRAVFVGPKVAPRLHPMIQIPIYVNRSNLITLIIRVYFRSIYLNYNLSFDLNFFKKNY